MPSSARERFPNLPNQLTVARLMLSVVVFVMIALKSYLAALVLFIVAASTDWLDGYFARRWRLITQLGRILDPFADKIIICGTFIFLAAEPASLMPAWVVVLVVGRELLITALRGYLEQQGADFSASMSGKLKMVAQCAAAILSLYLLTFHGVDIPGWLPTLVVASVWATVVLTVFSGVSYIMAAAKLMRL